MKRLFLVLFFLLPFTTYADSANFYQRNYLSANEFDIWNIYYFDLDINIRNSNVNFNDLTTDTWVSISLRQLDSNNEVLLYSGVLQGMKAKWNQHKISMNINFFNLVRPGDIIPISEPIVKDNIPVKNTKAGALLTITIVNEKISFNELICFVYNVRNEYVPIKILPSKKIHGHTIWWRRYEDQGD